MSENFSVIKKKFIMILQFNFANVSLSNRVTISISAYPPLKKGVETSMIKFETKSLPEEYEIAPDGSEIRPLLRLSGGGLAHCTLPTSRTSLASSHETVEEIWYCIQGRGQVWRKQADQEDTVNVRSGISLTIPVGTHFQFRNTGREPLCFIICTMPPWLGNHEASRVQEHWQPSRTQ